MDKALPARMRTGSRRRAARRMQCYARRRGLARDDLPLRYGPPDGPLFSEAVTGCQVQQR